MADAADDEQNQWITNLRKRNDRSWKVTGQRIANVFGLGDDYLGLFKHFEDDGASVEFACKRSLRELQLEHDLDYVADVAPTLTEDLVDRDSEDFEPI